MGESAPAPKKDKTFDATVYTSDGRKESVKLKQEPKLNKKQQAAKAKKLFDQAVKERQGG